MRRLLLFGNNCLHGSSQILTRDLDGFRERVERQHGGFGGYRLLSWDRCSTYRQESRGVCLDRADDVFGVLPLEPDVDRQCVVELLFGEVNQEVTLCQQPGMKSHTGKIEIRPLQALEHLNVG